MTRSWIQFVRLFSLAVILVALGCQHENNTASVLQDRERPSPDTEGEESDPAQYYDRTLAIIIGIDSYTGKGWKVLERAVNDARSIDRVLRQEFGYSANNIKLLLDSDANQASIIDAFTAWLKDKKLQENDAILVFFAGHGETGYLIPADATKQDLRKTAISMEWIKERLKQPEIPCRHKMLILDSCYSGTLFNQTSVGIANSSSGTVVRRKGSPNGKTRGGGWQEDTLAAYVQGRAFVGISAGRDTVVVDEQGEGENSLFTTVLLQVLEERANSSREDHIFFGQRLASEVEERVANARGSGQRPKWGLLEPGDGDFVFKPTINRSTPREISQDRQRKLKVRRYVKSLKSAKAALDRGNATVAARILREPLSDRELAARFEGRFLANLIGAAEQPAVTRINGWVPAISCDGTQMALQRHDTLVLFDLLTGKEIGQWEGYRPISFTFADGRLLVQESSGQGALLNLADGHIESLESIKQRNHAAKKSANGSTIAMINDEGVSIWDSQGSFRLRHQLGEPEYLYSGLAVSPDGTTIAYEESIPYNLVNPRAGIRERRIVIVNSNSGRNLGTIQMEEYMVSDLEFSPDGDLLAVAMETAGPMESPLPPGISAKVRQVRLYDTSTNEIAMVIDGFRTGNEVVAFSPDGTTLAVGGNPNADQPREEHTTGSTHVSYVSFFDLWTGQEIYRVQVADHVESGLTSLNFLPSNDGLVVSDQTGTFLWRAAPRENVEDLGGFFEGVASTEREPPNGEPKVFEIDGIPFVIDKSGQYVSSVRAERDGSRLVVKYAKWNVRTGKIVQSGQAPVSCKDDTIEFAKSGNCRIPFKRLKDWRSRREMLVVWKPGENNLEGVSLEDFHFGTFEAAWDLNRSRLAASGVSGDNKDGVGIWDLHTGRRLLHIPECEPDWPLVWSPVGEQFVTLGLDDRMALWDASTGAKLRNMGLQAPDAMGFSGDGNVLVGLSNGIFDVVDVTSGRRTGNFDAPAREECSCLAVNHDGSLVTTGHTDGSLILWYMAQESAVHKLSAAHDSPICCVTFTDSGEIVSASLGGVIDVRPVPKIVTERDFDDYFIE